MALGSRVGAVAAGVLPLLLLAVSCTSGQQPPGPPPFTDGPTTTSALPGVCTATVTRPGAVAGALADAAPGATVCFSGTELADARILVTVSGRPGAPLRLVADGATVRAVDVRADHVIVEGFTIADGQGLDLAGAGLVARGNVLRNAADDGISCDTCTDATIESNVVDGSDGTGIALEGARIAVLGNTVSRSVRRESGDADGIRFFGTGHRITGNTVENIKDDGFPEGEEPHTDCFQTFDDDSPPTYDVLIADNLCRNVDHQCLIGTGDERGNAGIPPGTRAISFVGNVCETEGSQSVYLQNYPAVEVRDNSFAGPHLFRGVLLEDGATGGLVVGNTMLADAPVYEVDETSRPGLRAAGNTGGR